MLVASYLKMSHSVLVHWDFYFLTFCETNNGLIKKVIRRLNYNNEKIVAALS